MSKVSKVLEALDFSDENISSRSNLPIDRVRSILAGSDVSQAELRALSFGLRIPLKTFASGEIASSHENNLGLLFRNAKIDKRTSYEGAIETVYSYIDGALSILPKRQKEPEWLANFIQHEESYIEAQRLAYLFREIYYQKNFDEPAINLSDVLVNKASVIISQLRHSRYEGASVIAGGYCFIFVSPRFRGRMLFTLAHELGHLIAHHSDGELAVFDKPTQIGSLKSGDKAEAFVDTFASVLLLPERGIGIALKSIRELYKIQNDEIGDVEILVLARMFGVSFEAAAYRCETLNLLPRGGARSLYDHLKKHHGSPEKRANELGLPPRMEANIPHTSSNLLQHLIEKITSEEISIGWATDHFGLSIDDIYSWHAEADGFELHH